MNTPSPSMPKGMGRKTPDAQNRVQSARVVLLRNAATRFLRDMQRLNHPQPGDHLSILAGALDRWLKGGDPSTVFPKVKRKNAADPQLGWDLALAVARRMSQGIAETDAIAQVSAEYSRRRARRPDKYSRGVSESAVKKAFQTHRAEAKAIVKGLKRVLGS